MNILMILIGTSLDRSAAILLLAPIFAGIAAQISIDPIQLGVMMVMNLAIGLYTPPVGTPLSSRWPLSASPSAGRSRTCCRFISPR